MITRVLASPEDFNIYDHWIKNHPHGSLWQSIEWKRYQEKLGREVRIYVMEDSSTPSPLPSPHGGWKMIVASALVIIDRTTFGLSTWDIPRGPLSDFRLIEMIMRDAKNNKCISLYLSHPVPLLTTHYSLQTSQRHEQPEATRIIDLTKAQPEILAQMKPKGRYNIRITKKHGVEVNESQDTDIFYELLSQTSKRDGFKPLPKSHYEIFLKVLPGSFLLLASISTKKTPVAGLMGVCWNTQGIYYYGASDYAYRATMATYLLQWEAIKRCKEQGCKTYDLLGIVKSPPPSSPPSGGGTPHHWAGVSAFKEKFGGKIVEYPEEQEIVIRPLLKTALALKRKLLG